VSLWTNGKVDLDDFYFLEIFTNSIICKVLKLPKYHMALNPIFSVVLSFKTRRFLKPLRHCKIREGRRVSEGMSSRQLGSGPHVRIHDFDRYTICYILPQRSVCTVMCSPGGKHVVEGCGSARTVFHAHIQSCEKLVSKLWAGPHFICSVSISSCRLPSSFGSACNWAAGQRPPHQFSPGLCRNNPTLLADRKELHLCPAGKAHDQILSSVPPLFLALDHHSMTSVPGEES
jgi:hypothetical protein